MTVHEQLVSTCATGYFEELETVFQESADTLVAGLEPEIKVDFDRTIVIDGQALTTIPDLYWRVAGHGPHHDILCEVRHC